MLANHHFTSTHYWTTGTDIMNIDEGVRLTDWLRTRNVLRMGIMCHVGQ